jgi:hypothetical protein
MSSKKNVSCVGENYKQETIFPNYTSVSQNYSWIEKCYLLEAENKIAISLGYSPKVNGRYMEIFPCQIRIPLKDYPPTPDRKPPPRDETNISKFSTKSRRKMLNVLTRINFKKYKKVVFLTTTFHRVKPTDKHILKYMLKRFIKKLSNNRKNIDYIWRVENQDRGMPHFHIILLYKNWSGNYTENEFNAIMTTKWLDITKEINEYSIKHSCKTIFPEEKNNYAFYCAKYCSKEEKKDTADILNRRWGSSYCLFINPLSNLTFDERDLYKIKLALVEYVKRQLQKSKRKNKTLSKEFELYILNRYHKQIFIPALDLFLLLKEFQIPFLVDGEPPDCVDISIY